MRSKTRGTGSGSVIVEADVGVQAQEVQQPAAGDVGEPAHVGSSERSSSSTART